jgi:hypothetical protein
MDYIDLSGARITRRPFPTAEEKRTMVMLCAGIPPVVRIVMLHGHKKGVTLQEYRICLN